jgi:hypothetical protein
MEIDANMNIFTTWEETKGAVTRINIPPRAFQKVIILPEYISLGKSNHV